MSDSSDSEDSFSKSLNDCSSSEMQKLSLTDSSHDKNETPIEEIHLAEASREFKTKGLECSELKLGYWN